MLEHGLNEEYIKTIENVYNEKFMEDEENEIKEFCEKYHNRIKAYAQLLDEIIRNNDLNMLERFMVLFNSLLSEGSKYFTEETICIYHFGHIYLEEKSVSEDTFVYTIKSYEDFKEKMLNIRFEIWRIVYLGESIANLKTYIKENEITICMLYKAVMISCVDKEKGMMIMKKLAENNKKWCEYLEKKVID